MKVVAVVAAYNEEENIGNVLKVLLSSKDLDEVIVVDDGSKDRTAEIAERLGARVIRISPNQGKGNAMKEGIKQTDAEIIAFFDADLTGLTREHIPQLIAPVLEGRAVECVGLRDRWWFFPEFLAKLDPLLAIGGERVMKRFVFEKIPFKFMKGFMVETSINYYCSVKKLPVLYVKLKGLNQVIKEKKWGIISGFLARLKMILQILKIRAQIITHRKEFEALDADGQ